MKFHLRLGYYTAQNGRLRIVELWYPYRISRAVTSIQDCQFHGFSVPQLFFFCAEEENSVDEIMTGNVECSQ